jgi:hypothetical protein
MRTPTVTMSYARSNDRLVLSGALGCLLALAMGAVAATGHGLLVAGAIVGLVICVAGTIVYVRDPVLALIWLWLFEVFNAPISAAVGYSSAAGEAVRQGDEVLVLLFVGLTVWRTTRIKMRMPPMRFLLPGIGVALCGLLGAVLHGVPFTVAALGAWLGLKFWLLVGITLLLPWTLRDVNRVYSVLMRVGLVVAALGLVDYLTHEAVSRALHTSIYRFGSEVSRAEAVHSIFPHPGEYSLFMSLLFALAFTRFAMKRNRSDLALALLFAGSVMLSLRLKGFLSLAAVALIVAIVQGAASNRGGVTALLVGSLLVIGAYSVEGSVIAHQVAHYTSSSETSVRGQLYSTGERIARDDFPLGAGFGRFASYPSRLYYSPVYAQYELSSVFGLSRAFPNYITDTSWPSVIGETGYGGFAIYLLGVVLLILAVVNRLRKTTLAMKFVPLSALCAIAVLLTDSLGDPTLFDWLATTSFAMVLGPALVAAYDRTGLGDRAVVGELADTG